jgi:RNA polymerase sigma-70 factor (ECF subfamily)
MNSDSTGRQSKAASRTKRHTPKTRKSLLHRLKNWEDQDSWQEFFKIYETLIRDTALKSGLNPTESQEVVQETLLSVAKKIAGFDYDPESGTFKGWLLTIIRRRIVDQFRKRHCASGQRTYLQDPVALETFSDPAGSQLESLWNEEWHQALLEMARSLVKRRVGTLQYQMFDLYAIQQLPMKTVTKRLGVNAARVYMAKYRVTRLLKRELDNLEKAL